jgi:hypothetical protein
MPTPQLAARAEWHEQVDKQLVGPFPGVSVPQVRDARPTAPRRANDTRPGKAPDGLE